MKEFECDLRMRRAAAKMTLQETADEAGYSRDHIWKIETGRVCPSVDSAVAIAKLFNGFHGKKDGVYCFFVPEGNFDEFAASFDKDEHNTPDDEDLHDLNDTEHNLNVMEQAEDAIKVIRQLTASPITLRIDQKTSDALRVEKYKELFELDWAVRGRLNEGRQLHPELVEEGERRALAERPGYKEGDGIERVA